MHGGPDVMSLVLDRNCEAHIYDKELRELMAGGSAMMNRPAIRVVYLATMSVSRPVFLNFCETAAW